jgi:hypothetical protein
MPALPGALRPWLESQEARGRPAAIDLRGHRMLVFSLEPRAYGRYGFGVMITGPAFRCVVTFMASPQ